MSAVLWPGQAEGAGQLISDTLCAENGQHFDAGHERGSAGALGEARLVRWGFVIVTDTFVDLLLACQVNGLTPHALYPAQVSP